MLNSRDPRVMTSPFTVSFSMLLRLLTENHPAVDSTPST